MSPISLKREETLRYARTQTGVGSRVSSHRRRKDELTVVSSRSGHPLDTSQPAFPLYHRKLANPSPLGLSAFALTTFVLSLVNIGADGKSWMSCCRFSPGCNTAYQHDFTNAYHFPLSAIRAGF